MAKKEINFSTYAKRDLAKSTIDWSEISKSLTDDLTKIQEDRVKRRTDIDDDTIQTTNTLTTLEEYDNADLGTLALGMSNQSAQFLSVQADLQKRGLISATDLAQGKQRVLADWKQFSNITKQWNTDYAEYVKRLDSGEASSLEEWLNEQNVAFGNLQNISGYVNPETGRLSLVELDEKTGLPSKDPGKHVSMNTINNRFKTQYDAINTTDLVKTKVDSLGALLRETLGANQEVYGEKGWGTMKDNVDFQEQMRNQTNSLLTDSNVAVIAGSPALKGKYTYNEEDIENEKSTDLILMKIVNGRPVLDKGAKNIEAVQKVVGDLLYGEAMIQLDEEYSAEKGFEISTQLAEERVRGDIDSKKYRDQLAKAELNLKEKKLDLDEKVAAGNMTAQEKTTELNRDRYELDVLKYETQDGLVNAQIDKMYADIDLGRDKLNLQELTGDRNYKIALMNETYKSKLLVEKKKLGIVPFTYSDPNKISFFDGVETTGNKYVQENLGENIILSDDFWTADKKEEVQKVIGGYVKGMLDANVYNKLAEQGGFDVQWNKDDSGKPKNENGLVITIGGVKYPYPPQGATDKEIALAMKEDKSLSRDAVVKKLNDSNGYNTFTAKGFVPKGLQWFEMNVIERNEYAVQNTESFFSWITEFVLNPSTTAAIALQEPEEEEVGYIEKIEGGEGNDIFEEVEEEEN